MKVRSFLEVLLYLVLVLACAFLFLLQTIQDYREGLASISVSQESVSLNDMPTIIICWPTYPRKKESDPDLKYVPYIYGRDFVIDLKLDYKEIVSLVEDQSVETSLGLDLHLSEFRLRKKADLSSHSTFYMTCFMGYGQRHGHSAQSWELAMMGWPAKQCYKITPNNYENADKSFGVEVALKFLNDSVRHEPFEPEVLMSGEDNAYGVAGGNWFDGRKNLKCVKIKNKTALAVTAIHEYHHIPSRCSHDSYYLCLAKRFLNAASNDSHDCKTNCAPFSLPLPKDQLPLCQEENDRICNENVLKKLAVDQKHHCKRVCVNRDILFEKYKWGGHFNKNPFKGPYKKLFLFKYYFNPHRQSEEFAIRRSEHRLDDNFKTVKREYLVMSTMSFVGNVGGTLGMFVGFSFLGVTGWIMDITELWSLIKKTQPKQFNQKQRLI